jgi:hypothetical protein
MIGITVRTIAERAGLGKFWYHTVMIARISGTIVDCYEKGVVIETHGIGYLVFTPVTLPLGSDITLFTHLVIREDAQ